MSMKNYIGIIGNRTRDLPACSAVPQPTAPPRTPKYTLKTLKNLPLHVSVLLSRSSSGGSWTVFCQVPKLRSIDILSLQNLRFAAVCHYSTSVHVSGVPYWVKPCHGVHSVRNTRHTYTQTDCNDIGPQTAQFYSERISTDLKLGTWQSTVHELPEDGPKSGTETCKGRFLGVLVWILVLFNPAAAQLLRSWVRIPPGAWIFVCCECRVLSGRGLCDELITRPEESYRMWWVVVCDLEASRICAPYIYIYMTLVA